MSQDNSGEYSELNLLETSVTTKSNRYLTFSESFLCILIGLPVGFLSGLSVLSHREGFTLGELNTPDDFSRQVALASEKDLVLASLAFIAAAGVTTFIAKRHLKPACQQVAKLFYRLLLVSKHCCGTGLYEPVDGTLAADLLLFLWSSCTALIFAKIGAESLSFLGWPGRTAGAILKFLLVSTTRYMASMTLLKDSLDGNRRLKQAYLNMLTIASPKALQDRGLETPVEEPKGLAQVNDALVTYLDEHNKKQTSNQPITLVVLVTTCLRSGGSGIPTDDCASCSLLYPPFCSGARVDESQ